MSKVLSVIKARVESFAVMVWAVLRGMAVSFLPLLRAFSVDVVVAVWQWLASSPKLDRASIEAELRQAFLSALAAERPEIASWLAADGPHEIPPAVWSALVDVVEHFAA